MLGLRQILIEAAHSSANKHSRRLEFGRGSSVWIHSISRAKRVPTEPSIGAAKGFAAAGASASTSRETRDGETTGAVNDTPKGAMLVVRNASIPHVARPWT